MNIEAKILQLYNKDTTEAYKNLKALETLSETESTLYAYLDEFLAMLASEKYVIRVRGFRLACKQARWDTENKLDAHIGAILAALQDEKPTAVRQALQYLLHLAPHKKNWHEQLRTAALAIDLSVYKDTMAPLIAKDIQKLLACIEENR